MDETLTPEEVNLLQQGMTLRTYRPVWEYTLEQLRLAVTNTEFVDFLNQLGADGWEIVMTNVVQDSYLLLFKRIKADSE